MRTVQTIVEPYFDHLEEVIGHLAREAERAGITAGNIARDYLSDANRRTRFRDDVMPSLIAFACDFWRTNGPLLQAHLDALPGARTLFGGDIGPQPVDSVIERAAVYFDTVVVPDPLLRVATTLRAARSAEDYFLKYAVSLVQLSRLFLADVTPPIAVLVPDVDLRDNSPVSKDLLPLAEIDCVGLMNMLFGTNLQSMDEATSFVLKFPSLQSALKEIQAPEAIYFDEDAPRDPAAQADGLIRSARKDWDARSFTFPLDSGYMLLFTLFGRMLQASDQISKAAGSNAHLLVSAPVSFHWLRMKAAVNRKFLGDTIPDAAALELAKTNAILSPQNSWLANVPIESLVELRKRGRLNDIRQIISSGLDSLQNGALDRLALISNQVDLNLSTALADHQARLVELNSSLRWELGITGTTLSLTVAAAVQPMLGTMLPSWLGPVAGLFGAAKLKDVIVAVRKHVVEKKTLGKSPVGILWHAKHSQQPRNETPP